MALSTKLERLLYRIHAKVGSTAKNLPCLQSPVHLEKEMGKELGGGALLLPSMPFPENGDEPSCEASLQFMNQLVWFKRDLRLRDHAAFSNAARRGPVLFLYCVEPDLINADDFGELHWKFIRESLVELDDSLRTLGSKLTLKQGHPVSILQSLLSQNGIFEIHAHEETGNALSFRRDLSVRKWAKANQVPFHEYPQNGVVRRLANRDGWSGTWETRMRAPILPIPEFTAVQDHDSPPLNPPTSNQLGLAREFCQLNPLKGGATEAKNTLVSFLSSRGKGYSKRMSSPNTAPIACSRLSPYLAYGCLSMREVVQATRARISEIKGDPNLKNASSVPGPRDLSSFLSRCHWHCHFIQKLESEPEIEFRNFNPSTESLRPRKPNTEYLEAWKNGRTGYPFIDACMRYLRAHGWINFRMRAMLVSFAAYDLWLDWRDFKDFLAKTFIDYEPGIHYSQLQMQSGVTGINTLRMYNPTKQGLDQDPDGTFIRQWVPELAHLPKESIHSPYETPLLFSGSDYPPPIVDHAEAIKEARVHFKSLRSKPEFQASKKAVLEKHGSRKRG